MMHWALFHQSIEVSSFVFKLNIILIHFPKGAGETQLKNDQNSNIRSKTQANQDQIHSRRHDHFNNHRHPVSNQLTSSSEQMNHHDRLVVNRNRPGIYEQVFMIRSTCVPRIVGLFFNLLNFATFLFYNMI